jgi:hypothetical protein
MNVLSWTFYCTVFISFVLLLWRKFIYEGISGCDVNKSGNSLYVDAPEVYWYHLQLITSFAVVKKNILNIPHPPASYLNGMNVSAMEKLK